MDRLFLPKGCEIDGAINAVHYDGDIVIENGLVAREYRSENGGLTISGVDLELKSDTLAAEEGVVSVELKSLEAESVLAKSANLMAGHIQTGWIAAREELFVQASHFIADALSGNKVQIESKQIQSGNIDVQGDLVLKGDLIKVERIKAKTLIVHGHLECREVIVESSVVVEAGKVTIKSLDCPSFHAAPDVTGIVMVATASEVRAEGVRGFLHPDEIGMLTGGDASSMPTMDLRDMAESKDEEPIEETVTAEVAESLETVEVEEVAETPEMDVVEDTAPEAAAAEPVEDAPEASVDELPAEEIAEEETPTTLDEDAFDVSDEDNDFEELPAAEDLDSFETMDVSAVSVLEEEETTAEEVVVADDFTAIDDIEEIEDIEEDSAAEVIPMPTSEVASDFDASDLEMAPVDEFEADDFGDSDFEDIAESLADMDDLEPVEAEEFDDIESLDEIDDIEEMSSADLDEIGVETFDDELDTEFESLAEFADDDDSDEPLDVMELGVDDDDEEETIDTLNMEPVADDDPEAALVTELKGILAHISSFFAENSVPASINQIQRYLDEGRYQLFAKSRNRDAVVSNFDKFNHPEISRLAREFFSRLDEHFDT